MLSVGNVARVLGAGNSLILHVFQRTWQSTDLAVEMSKTGHGGVVETQVHEFFQRDVVERVVSNARGWRVGCSMHQEKQIPLSNEW